MKPRRINSARAARSMKHPLPVRLLELLRDGKWHPTKELVRKIGHRFGAAKLILMNLHWDIEKRRHRTRRHQWEYRLVDAK